MLENFVFINFAKFTGKYLCWSLFFNKVAGHQQLSELQCFTVNLTKFPRTLFLIEQLQATASGIRSLKISSLKSKKYILSINVTSLFKIYYNITTIEKLLRRNAKT